MVIQPLMTESLQGYINPYYWVDDHPLLYGNNASLDPTCSTFHKNYTSATSDFQPGDVTRFSATALQRGTAEESVGGVVV